MTGVSPTSPALWRRHYEYPHQAARPEVKRGTPRHPKTKALSRALKLPPYAATGILEMLWQYTEEFAMCGDIGKVDDMEIASAVGWDRDPGELIDSLVSCGWLERSSTHRLVVHDWHEHCNDYTKRKLKDKGLVFASLTVREEIPQKILENSGKFSPAIAIATPVPIHATPSPPPAALPRGMALDEQYANFREEYRDWAPHMIPEDFLGDSWRQWRLLDGLQRQAAIDWVSAHKRSRDPAFAMKPAKFLRSREWTRPDAPVPKKPEAVPFSQRDLPESRWNWGANGD
jgi:hypothetical protein